MAPANRDHAFDLHVLSMPPAFVLSQDQTLMFNPDKPAILSDDRPVVQGPAPALKTEPNKGHQMLCARYPPPNALSGPDQSVPRARPTALAAARASLLYSKFEIARALHPSRAIPINRLEVRTA